MKAKTPSFRQGMPESSARDGNFSDAQVFDLGNAAGHSLPSWTMDSGIHAGMTVLFLPF